MAVENEQDAFVATKQAIYCILYDWDPVIRYRGADTRGTAITNAIINLVNIGRYGDQTPANTEVTTNKIGGFVEDGEYYTQEYSVSSAVETLNYTITATNGLPEGSQITNVNNNAQTNFGGNEHFKVRIPKQQITNDINAVIALQAKSKTYPVFYGETTRPGTQNYLLTFDPFGDTSGRANLNVKTDTGTIKIVKNDTETNMPIAGVTFQLTTREGKIVANSTTNNEGIATFSGLYANNYILKEISTRNDYILSDKTFDVNVEYNKTVNKTITNDHKKGSIKIYKKDADNNKIMLGNVEFKLYSEEFKRVIGTYYTDVNGELKIENLRTGNYKLIETKTNKWYNLGEDTEVEVEWDKETVKDIENEPKKGQIKVIKVDKENNKIKLKGVQFEVLNENNDVLERITTDEKGEALTKEYAIRDFNKLKLRESKTLENYALTEEVNTITLKENQIQNVIVENEKKKGQIKVIKKDQDNNEILLEGVKFEVKNEKGDVVANLITDKNGEATTKPLPIDSKYTVIEKETKKEYVITEKPQTITLKENEIKNVEFKNEKKKGQIKVIKRDLDDKEVLLEGVKFEVRNEKGDIVDNLITNKEGEAVTKRLPIDSKYTVIEKETKKEYVLTEETQTITLKENEIKSVTFNNKKIEGYLEITKIDSKTKETLAGAKFGIYDENNKEVAQITTDSNGKAKSKLLTYGKYYAKELETGSVYYLLNTNTFEFEIIKNHETVEKTVENEPTDFKVDVDKKGTVEIKPGEKVYYDFSNVANNSNTHLENFKWYDYIPTDYIRLEKMSTGIWNQELSYNVYYKTNKSEEYVLFRENLSTLENYDLDFTNIQFTEDEYITETIFDFGKVEEGFKESTKPTMQCVSFDTLKDGQTFTNHTKTVGLYWGVTSEADSDWSTIVHEKEKPEPILPKTGK